jgi:hypothetical protein
MPNSRKMPLQAVTRTLGKQLERRHRREGTSTLSGRDSVLIFLGLTTEDQLGLHELWNALSASQIKDSYYVQLKLWISFDQRPFSSRPTTTEREHHKNAKRRCMHATESSWGIRDVVRDTVRRARGRFRALAGRYHNADNSNDKASAGAQGR